MAPLAPDHDAIVARLRALAKRLSPSQIGSAFVASFDGRPATAIGAGALMNYTQVAHLPAHGFEGTAARPDLCVHCGFDTGAGIDPEESEREARGGEGVPGSLGLPYDVALRLEALARALPLVPSAAARERFVALFTSVSALAPTASEGELRKAMGRSKILPNAGARAAALESLGAAGVLSTPEHRGFFGRHVGLWARQERPRPRVEADPPICLWRARDGVHAEAFAHYFGHLELAVTLRAPVAPSPAKARPKKAPPTTELEPGDVFAFALPDGRFRAGIVVGFLPSKTAGPGPQFVFFDAIHAALPALVDVLRLAIGPRRVCLYKMLRRRDPDARTRYVHLGRADVPELPKTGCSVEDIKDLDRILAGLPKPR